ncbi:MAG: response regulator transcription factor [Gammaproteobacteria bacterium]
MTNDSTTVFVVDDDASVRRSLQRLLRGAGYAVEVFSSAADFLRREAPNAPSCAVLDVAMPEMGGLELQERLADQRWRVGIVFLTGHGDIPSSVRAMRNGAIDFLTKPVDEDCLLAAIDAALIDQHLSADNRSELEQTRQRFADLSTRESEVMRLVVEGKLNKQIAGELGISEKTVKAHRAKVMHKTNTRSVAELVQLYIAADLSDT